MSARKTARPGAARKRAQAAPSINRGQAISQGLARRAARIAKREAAEEKWDQLLLTGWEPRTLEALVQLRREVELRGECDGQLVTQESAEALFARCQRLLHALHTLRICGYLKDTAALREKSELSPAAEVVYARLQLQMALKRLAESEAKPARKAVCRG